MMPKQRIQRTEPLSHLRWAGGFTLVPTVCRGNETKQSACTRTRLRAPGGRYVMLGHTVGGGTSGVLYERGARLRVLYGTIYP